jgi:hypothetical protein
MVYKYIQLLILNKNNMGLFNGLLETAVSPIRTVTKTVDKAINEDWDDKDFISLGASKIVKAVGEEAEEIENKFKDEKSL